MKQVTVSGNATLEALQADENEALAVHMKPLTVDDNSVLPALVSQP